MKYLTIAATAVALSAGAANASTFQLDMSGELNFVGGGVPAGAPFAFGDAASLSVTFDDDVATGSITDFENAITSFSGNFGGYNFSGGTGQITLGNENTTISQGTASLGPLDAISIELGGLAFNSSSLGGNTNRNDFTSDDGPIGGQPLRSVEFDFLAAIFDSNDFLNSTPFDVVGNTTSISDALLGAESNFSSVTDPFATLTGLRIFFSDQAFGSFPISATARLDTFTLTEVNTTAPVPVPASLPLLAAGLIGMGALARRKKSA